MSDQVRLILRPDVPPMSWDDFRKMAGPFSIAGDGFVQHAPCKDLSGPYLNIDHHFGVYGPATRCASAQALTYVRTGLLRRFQDDNGYRADVYLNHADEDACLLWWILKNAFMSQFVVNPLLNKLVDVEDKLDSSAGAYPYPKEMDFLQVIAWIFQPYQQARASGEIYKKDPKFLRSIVDNVELRINAYLVGNAQSIPLDLRYERIGGGNGWTLVREIGAQARIGMFADGLEAFVSVTELPNGRRKVSLSRMSDMIPFEVPIMCQLCNELEGLTDSDDRWGGRDNTGGSPRVNGTGLTIEQIVGSANETVRMSI